MDLPRQSAPVIRRHITQPSDLVDVVNASGTGADPDTLEGERVGELISVRIKLMHGLNSGDPQAWTLPTFGHMRQSGGRSA
jgi:cyanobactin biosynthesis protein (PatB/AcyB/McaB family)